MCSGAYGLTSCYPDWLLLKKGLQTIPLGIPSNSLGLILPLTCPYSKPLLETTLAKKLIFRRGWLLLPADSALALGRVSPVPPQGKSRALLSAGAACSGWKLQLNPPGNTCKSNCVEQAATSSTSSQRRAANWVRGQHCNGTWTSAEDKVWQTTAWYCWVYSRSKATSTECDICWWPVWPQDSA